MIKSAVILCGGYGKRLLPLTKKTPKPMINVLEKPFLYYLIKQCKSNGIKEVILLCGYKSELIKKYFGNGNKLGIKIKYSFNPPQVNTYKRVVEAQKILKNDFLLLYGDNYASLNLHDMYSLYKKLNSKLLISIASKNYGNVKISNCKKKLIKKYYFKKNLKEKNVEIGYMIVNKKILLKYYNHKNSSINKLIDILATKKLANYYNNDTGYLSISDKSRLNKTIKAFNKRVLLIDRDGVLNKKNQNHYYVRNLGELEINTKLIKKLKKVMHKKTVLCISNQAGIATGDLKKTNLKMINDKLNDYLKKMNCQIKEFFISYDHFNSSSFLRKPKHGLFLKAAEKYGFVLDQTCYIGDDIRDIEASYNAKTKCLYVGRNKISNSLIKKYRNTLISYKDLRKIYG